MSESPTCIHSGLELIDEDATILSQVDARLFSRSRSLVLQPRTSLNAANLVPPGFTEALVASGLSSPTAMQFSPDGRLFVCEQGGRLRVIADG